jgi:hypothetical protein
MDVIESMRREHSLDVITREVCFYCSIGVSVVIFKAWEGRGVLEMENKSKIDACTQTSHQLTCKSCLSVYTNLIVNCSLK